MNSKRIERWQNIIHSVDSHSTNLMQMRHIEPLGVGVRGVELPTGFLTVRVYPSVLILILLINNVVPWWGIRLIFSENVKIPCPTPHPHPYYYGRDNDQ